MHEAERLMAREHNSLSRQVNQKSASVATDLHSSYACHGQYMATAVSVDSTSKPGHKKMRKYLIRLFGFFFLVDVTVRCINHAMDTSLSKVSQ